MWHKPCLQELSNGIAAFAQQLHLCYITAGIFCKKLLEEGIDLAHGTLGIVLHSEEVYSGSERNGSKQDGQVCKTCFGEVMLFDPRSNVFSIYLVDQSSAAADTLERL